MIPAFAGLLSFPAWATAQAPVPPRAQGPMVLTLDEALTLAEARSQQVAIAAAGVARANAVERRARSERFPQLFGAASYDRALASEFSDIFGGDRAPSCPPLQVDPTASLEARVAELERAYDCQPTGGLFGGGDGGGLDLPFGRENTYRLNVTFNQAVYAGGRIAAQERQARLGTGSAVATLTTARAQLVLDVARAYLNAALSDRIVTIAEASFEQADRAFQQTRAQREVGRVSEFELLRAQVARDTLRPDVIRQRAAREIAYLQLKQLLEVPPPTEVRLAAQLDADVPITEKYGAVLAEVEAGLVSRERIGVAQAERAVAVQEAAVTIARSQRLPNVSVNSGYGLVSYPSTVPAFGDWRTNWTVGAAVQVPILTGGRLRADEAIARADVEEARQRLILARELADLDFESAWQELAAARAAWEASGSTVVQAQRAYEIAELRYREGLSTQLELSDARLLLQQAELNRAQAARDLQLARVRLALLPELPLTVPSSVTPVVSGVAFTAATSGSALTRGTTAATTPAAGAQQR